MIVIESYNSVNETPLFKIYSDKGFFLQYNGVKYVEAFINKEEDKDKYIETNSPIPSLIANTTFVYEAFLGEFHNITQRDVLAAKPIIEKAVYSLNSNDLYGLFNLLNKWQIGQEYDDFNVVVYHNYIYKVLQHHIAVETPDKSELYEKVERPINFIIEWEESNTPYSTGEKVRVGDNFYQSQIDNNVWSPTVFPAAWQLIGSQV